MSFRHMVLKLSAAVLLCAATAGAQVKLDDCFSDHMVLQRELPARVRGTAAPGEKVSVSFAGQTVEATADAEGEWQVTFAPLKANKEPAEMVVKGENNTVTIKDILVGEVWICSGQSNMEYRLGTSKHVDKEALVAAANYPLIRTIHIPRTRSINPSRTVPVPWKPVLPENIKPFTAVGYFFGVELYKALDVPIGLVNASWGGTRIEPWTNADGFRSVPQGEAIAKSLAARTGGTREYDAATKKYMAAMRKWLAEANAEVAKKRVPPAPPEYPAEFSTTGRTTPGVLYNGMSHPFTGMTVRGAIWYQGEANLGQWFDYDWQMHALLNGWKKAFSNPDLHFFFVQIAPYRYRKEMPRNCLGLWARQQRFADESKSGMAVINDYGNPTDIHPTDKRPVGDRLARFALNRVYGKKDVVCDPPRPTGFKADGSKAVVEFSNAKSWSTADNAPIAGFELAGIDGKYVPAEAVADGAKIVVSAPGVAAPRYVRYLGSNVSLGNLRAESGLVPAPFRISNVTLDEELAYLSKREGLIYEYDLFSGAAKKVPAPIVDNSAKFAGKKLTRLSYLFIAKDKKGKTTFAEISLDPFASDLKLVGIPGSKASRNLNPQIRNIALRTNADNLIDGDEIKLGSIEFYFTNYRPQSRGSARQAPGERFDANDTPGGETLGYGCMQFHSCSGIPIICFNRLQGGKFADLGFGRNPNGEPDWTFSKSGKNYESTKLLVFGTFE